jgi:copper(I)-binding protein
MIRTIILGTALAVAIAWPARAAEVSAGSLTISASWARATPKGASVGGGYLSITNSGDSSDRLVGGSTDVAKGFEIHSMTTDNGVMKMRPVTGGLEVKPGQTVELKPGGYHVMFVGLKHGLKQGDHFRATLQFEKAGKVDVVFTVEGIGATHGGGMRMQHGK